MAIHELTSAEKAGKAQKSTSASKSKKTNTKMKPVFQTTGNNTNALQAPSTGWHSIEFNKIISNWGIRQYQWTPIANTDDAVKKSQNNLIDMIRYYEGDPQNNYKAKMQYADKSGTTTYGYGIVNPHLKFSAKIKEKYHLQFPVKTEYDAYKTMLVYMEEIAKKDVISRLGGEKEGTKLFNSLPQSVKEALLDYAFKNGAPTLNKVDGLKKALEDKNWPKVIDCLIWTKANAGEKKGQEMAGLYRRSLSRLILAAKDLPKSSEIDSKIEKLYTDGLKKAQAEGVSQEDFHKIYNQYKGITTTSSASADKTNADGTKSYRVNQGEIGVYSVALSLRPDSTVPSIDRKKLLIAIINEIISMNNLTIYGYENDNTEDVPKTDKLKPGTTYKLPTEITFNGTKIKLTTERVQMEDVTGSAKAQKQESQEMKKTDSVNTDTLINDSVDYEMPQIESKKENKSNGGWWKSGLIGAGLGLLSGLIKKSNNVKIAGRMGIGLAIGLGIYGLLKLFSKKTAPDDRFDPNDPNVTPFQRLYHSDNVNIKQHECTVETPDGKKETTLQILETEYTVKKYDGTHRETIWSIAKTFGMTRKELGRYNKLKLSIRDGVEDYHDIGEGQKLQIRRVGYKVEENETIESISTKFGISADMLLDANNMLDEDAANLREGTMLELPAYVHKVQAKETLSKIAEAAGISVKTLKMINNLKDDNIKEGQELIVMYVKNPDQKVVSEKTEDGKTVQKVKSDAGPNLGNRPELQTMSIVNGKIVATKAVFFDKSVKNGKLSGKTIILDAGHGYKSTGATDIGAPGNGIEDEWLLNYDNTMRLKNELIKQGAKVIYLQGSKKLIVDALNEKDKNGNFVNQGDLFISIHANSAAPSADERTQFYYRDYQVKKSDAKERSIKLAKIAKNVFDANVPVMVGTSKAQAQIGQPDSNGNPEGRTGLLRDVLNIRKMPAVLWEVAFMTNRIGKQRLQSKETMDKYASLMCQSIIEYYNGEN